MNDTRESRLRIRFVLLTILLATLPCYCTGIALVQIGGQPPRTQPTSTPLWAQPATETAAAATALIPSFTPFYVTATPPTPATPTLERTTSPTNTYALPPTVTTAPPTATETLRPSDTPFPTPSETLPPTVTETPSQPPYLPPTEPIPPPLVTP